jgi:N-acetylmuramoyl-L-alanine amidase
MLIRGRSCIAAFMACIILLCIAAPAYPSYNSEAGHKYAVASQRLADLRKSNKKQKYRSYWIDCIRTFELVEKQYPKSPNAADACFDRAGLYFELYQISRYSRDIDKSLQAYEKCQFKYPNHAKAAEGLYRGIELSLDFKKSRSTALKFYETLAEAYSDSTWFSRAKVRMGISDAKTRTDSARTAKSSITKNAGVVQAIRYWSEGDYTRIVIDQTGPFKFQKMELKKPDRLVFDILDSQINASLNKDPVPIHDGILKQVRASQYMPDTVRIVLDLASIKSYEAFPLRDPDRLVIDVTGEGGASPGEQTSSATTGTQVKEVSSPSVVPPVTAIPNNDEARLTLSRQMALKIKTIAIDAGHGGRDPGAIGRSGLKEKTITLDVAKRLAVLVKERLGYNVVMTRDRDVFIPLDQRPFIAKSHKADLFVSIHVNANRKRKTRGIETYVQGLKASDREAMATAARENAMSERTLGELDDVTKMLQELKIDNKIEESIQLAGNVQNSLVNTVRFKQKRVVNHGVKRAFFYVLMNTNIPSILAEIGFISNPEEEAMLRSASYRQYIAEALYQGVKKYVEARSPQMAVR